MALDVSKQPLVTCECGCGTMIRARGSNGASRRFVAGHAVRIREQTAAQREALQRGRTASFEATFVDGQRPCATCAVDYPKNEYLYGGKWRTSCRTCVSGSVVYDRKRTVMAAYRITETRAESLLAVTACEICDRVTDKTLHVDHNATTGAVRGMLCGQCNRAIGLLQHSPDVLRAAAAYLERTNNVG